ncbi:hypothetical protein FOL47_008029 [Perkinsus chesapeaki]|uniref:C3H1-type domain-containing protein n=1 Tax=Perkinsus chesapeaki TaxID=330153 RepID=A0A7J6N258_PERCH|nr:hypothetical protein FOL47_008029 [Perkinsus chesapeaki]
MSSHSTVGSPSTCTSATSKHRAVHRFRSRFCVYNVTGSQGCLDGDFCPFAHSPYQLARPKSYLCPSHLGYCRGLGICPFAHNESELEKSPMPVIKRICKFISTPRGCNLGAGCRNAHNELEMSTGIRVDASNRVDPTNDYVFSIYHRNGLSSPRKQKSHHKSRNNGLLATPLVVPSPTSFTLDQQLLSVTTPQACHTQGHFLSKSLLESVAATAIEDDTRARSAAVLDLCSSLACLLRCTMDQPAGMLPDMSFCGDDFQLLSSTIPEGLL